jgi:LPS-assembly lipoprotein
MVVAMLLMVSACGFQLRGTNTATALPESWRKMFLITQNANSEFSREVVARFASNGIEWVERDEAAYILRLGPEAFSQRNLSINAEARAAEFELSMRSSFSVNAASGEEVMESTEATVIKQMENDPRNVVGKAEEIRILKDEMRTELAQQIMRRIGFHAASTE